MNKGSNDTAQLHKYLSPIGAWALAFGCAVGWGSFVMPGTTFLPIAGPIGTALGMLIGGFMILLIGINYGYLMRHYPDAGGTFAYAKKEFGYDQGFLSSWFLLLVYMAIVWANATAIPLICKNLFRGALQIGPHYNVAGFDVYLTEAALSVAILLISSLICLSGGRIASIVQTILAFMLIGGVILCAGYIFIGHGIHLSDIQPAYAPNTSHALQVFRIVALAPWAYAGFESVSHSSEELRFSPRRITIVLAAALFTAAIAYSLLSLIAVTALPSGSNSWISYLSSLDSYSGIDGLPVFHAVYAHMGTTGFRILEFSVAAAILTGLIGNLTAASRLVYSISRERMFTGRFSVLNASGVPYKALIAITLISLPIPFLGRTAISWIVDVNTIGATLAYVYTSLAAFRRAGREHNTPIRITGLIGFVVSIILTLYFLIPNLWSVEALSSESYLILILWSVGGFAAFYAIMRRDQDKRFGNSTIVWMVLLFIVLFVTMLWFRETVQIATDNTINDLNAYNTELMAGSGFVPSIEEAADSAVYLNDRIDTINRHIQLSGFVQLAIILLTLVIMLRIYVIMIRRERDAELQMIAAEENSRAKSTFLSNMSHDIRSPMNAIIGYTEITQGIEGLPAEALDNLAKIDYSSRQLLSIINDVLDMSRIENGRMELSPESADLIQIMNDQNTIFAHQMKDKHLTFSVDCDNITDRYVFCDVDRINRVLLNLISNALKFTPEGGSVTVTLIERTVLSAASSDISKGHYELHVKDTGQGMSPEFAETVFEAYTRENTATRIQGTGLGMAITKSLVDLMGGEIRVESRQGQGTEFIIDLDLEITDEARYREDHIVETADEIPDYTGRRVLLVEDQIINTEIETMILNKYGFEVDHAENGLVAVDMIKASEPGKYDLILMDIQMPVMNGYEATEAIRALPDAGLSSIPILAMSANAFTEDIAKAREAGMNGHISKPIEINRMLDAISEIL